MVRADTGTRRQSTEIGWNARFLIRHLSVAVLLLLGAPPASDRVRAQQNPPSDQAPSLKAPLSDDQFVAPAFKSADGVRLSLTETRSITPALRSTSAGYGGGSDPEWDDPAGELQLRHHVETDGRLFRLSSECVPAQSLGADEQRFVFDGSEGVRTAFRHGEPIRAVICYQGVIALDIADASVLERVVGLPNFRTDATPPRQLDRAFAEGGVRGSVEVEGTDCWLWEFEKSWTGRLSRTEIAVSKSEILQIHRVEIHDFEAPPSSPNSPKQPVSLKRWTFRYDSRGLPQSWEHVAWEYRVQQNRAPRPTMLKRSTFQVDEIRPLHRGQLSESEFQLEVPKEVPIQDLCAGTPREEGSERNFAWWRTVRLHHVLIALAVVGVISATYFYTRQQISF